MNRKNLPLLLMLTAGAVTSIITFVRHYTVLAKLVALFTVMLVFFLLGSALKLALDYFDAQNEKRRLEEGEVIEKETDGQEGQEGGTAQEKPEEDESRGEN